MAYIAPAIRLTGDLVTAAIWNADIVANEIAINAGAIALTSQAIGDLIIASTTSQLSRVADVATGQVLVSGGVGVAPAYSGSPSLSGTLTVTGALAANGGITVDSTAFIVADTTGNMTCGTATTGLINGQTISSAANFTGTVTSSGVITSTAANGLVTATTGGSSATAFVDSSASGNGVSARYRTSSKTSVGVTNDWYVGTNIVSSDNRMEWYSTATVMSLTQAGLLTVSGFGTHTFSAGGTGGNSIEVRNTTAGTGNFSRVALGNDNDQFSSVWQTYSSTYTSSGFAQASGTLLYANGAGGFSIGAFNASGAIRFYAQGTGQIAEFSNTGLSVATTTHLARIYAVSGGNVHVIRGASNDAGYAGIYGSHSVNSSTSYPAYFANDGAGNGQYLTNTGSWVTISDARLKMDIRPLEVLDRLRLVQPRDFLWKSHTDSDQPHRRIFGFIAQEVQRVFPELVTSSPNGFFGVSYEGFIAPLVDGWQQHDATISQLAARIAALETKDN